jgi:hypothetical protein
MNEHGGGLRWGLSKRTRFVLGASVMLLGIGLGPSVAPAAAAVAPKTDVMFIFDTSGSMQSVLTEAKEEIATLIATTKASLGSETEFGVASVEDIPPDDFSEAEYEASSEKPWHLWQGLTSNGKALEESIEQLSGLEVAHSGDDLPEAYGRALYETATNPLVVWRPGARHEIVLIADNVPHTPNVNQGIPSEFQFTEPFNDGVAWPDTGEELEGRFGIPDTIWKPGESLEFHKTLQKLSGEEKPLAMVDYFHTNESPNENYIHYWEYWAAETGGQAITAEEGTKSLDGKLAEIIKESAEGIPPCPPGFERTPTTPCKPKPSAPPPSPPAPPVKIPTTAPISKHLIVLEDGEIEEEDEFDEPGEAEDIGVLNDGASLARFQGNPLTLLGGQQIAVVAKHKSNRCKKGFVKRGKKCINNAPVVYGSLTLNIPTAGRYKLKIKPSSKVRAALKQHKTLNVTLTLTFTPEGTADHIRSIRSVNVHLKPKPKPKPKKHKK